LLTVVKKNTDNSNTAHLTAQRFPPILHRKL